MGNIALAIDGATIYHQTASGATTPSGAIGDIWWCSDLTNTNGYYGLNYYDGTSWRNLGPDVVSSSTTPSAPFPGLVWINPNGTIQVYQSGAWTNLIAYKIPLATTDGQFLQYSSGLGALQWATISTVPTGATAGQILQYNGSANAWRNPPAIVAGYVATAGVNISTSGATLVPSSSMSGTLTGFTQYLLSVNFDTNGGTYTTQIQAGQPSVQAGTKPTVNGAVIVDFAATPTGGGAVIQERAFAGTFIANIDSGGTATAVINTAISTTVYAFSVLAATTVGSMIVKNGQFSVTGIK
jgi:hypothetical protein